MAIIGILVVIVLPKFSLVQKLIDKINLITREICKSLGLDHFINTLPKGDESMVLDGDISAGEKQLMTIARGVIKDAPFLILDEATSNVDTRTEMYQSQFIQ